MASRRTETSIHGKRLVLTRRGLKVDGKYIPDVDPGGNVFYVHNSGSSNASGLSPDEPISTLDAAIGRCTANNNDLIVVMANHAETVTGAGGIAADVAGVKIVGVGEGNQRPRFLMDGGTTVTFLVTAADVSVDNLVFAGGHDGIVRCFNISTGGNNFRATNIEFEDNTTAEHFLVAFDASGADNTADGLTVKNCKWVTIDSGVTDFVSTTGSIDRLTMDGNLFIADAATGAGMLLQATGKIATGLNFINNVLVCGNTSTDLLIDNDGTTNTGWAHNNYCGHHDVAAAILIDCDGIRLGLNYSNSTDTTAAALIPTADSIT